MINNILDQNGSYLIAGLFSLCDLFSDASKESRIEKLSKLHDIYGTPVIHTMKETWWVKEYLVANGSFGIKFR